MFILRNLYFLLLIWVLKVVKAQNVPANCEQPKLDGGFFLHQQIYPHGSHVSYACDEGRRTYMDGWWASAQCQRGKWSPKPICIDIDDCFPPDVPHAVTSDSKEFYSHDEKIRMKCDPGYGSVGSDATAKCMNGTWTSVPECVRKEDACEEPPKILNGVLTLPYQELFDSSSNISYECKTGYRVEQGQEKYFYCNYGVWTRLPQCIQNLPEIDSSHSGVREPVPGHGDGHGTSASGDPKPVGGGGHGTSTRPVGGGGHGTSTRPVGGGGHGTSTRPVGGGGHGTSANGGSKPVGGGVLPSSDPNPNEGQPPFLRVDECGTIPTIEHGETKKKSDFSLTYECSRYYKLEGSAEVVCFGERTWSALPTCKENYCIVRKDTSGLISRLSDTYLSDQEEQYFRCNELDYWGRHYLNLFICENGITRSTGCCHRDNFWCLRL